MKQSKKEKRGNECYSGGCKKGQKWVSCTLVVSQSAYMADIQRRLIIRRRYKLKKITGSIICALGTILPSFFIILTIALFFNHFQDNVWVVKVFNGIRPAVVALILVPCLSAAQALKLKRMELIFPLIGAVLIWKAGISPAYIVLAGIVGGLVYTFWIKDKIKKKGI